MRDVGELAAEVRRLADGPKSVSISFESAEIPGMSRESRVWPELEDPEWRLALCAILSVPPVVVGVHFARLFGRDDVMTMDCRRLT